MKKVALCLVIAFCLIGSSWAGPSQYYGTYTITGDADWGIGPCWYDSYWISSQITIGPDMSKIGQPDYIYLPSDKDQFQTKALDNVTSDPGLNEYQVKFYDFSDPIIQVDLFYLGIVSGMTYHYRNFTLKLTFNKKWSTIDVAVKNLIAPDSGDTTCDSFYVKGTAVKIADGNVSSPPATPNLSHMINGNDCKISWTSVPNADGYTLFYADYPAASSVKSLDIGAKTDLKFNLWKGAAFYIAVNAYNSAGDSDYSNIITVKSGGALGDVYYIEQPYSLVKSPPITDKSQSNQITLGSWDKFEATLTGDISGNSYSFNLILATSGLDAKTIEPQIILNPGVDDIVLASTSFTVSGDTFAHYNVTVTGIDPDTKSGDIIALTFKGDMVYQLYKKSYLGENGNPSITIPAVIPN